MKETGRSRLAATRPRARCVAAVLAVTSLAGGWAMVNPMIPVVNAEVLPPEQSLTSLEANGGFTDLEEAGGHRDNVERLADRGILEGTECASQQFCPKAPIQRWVMAVWLVRALDNTDPHPVASSRFSDVEGDEWWSPYVERLADLRVTRGCTTSPARFCPTEPVTRQQMASFLVRAFKLERAPGNQFIDVGEGNPHLVDINALVAAGITAGCAVEPARFCPARDTTRAQMATFLARILGVATTPPKVAPGGDFAEVTAGWDHTCALEADGAVQCWGANSWGQTESPEGRFITIAAGGNHTCGIRTDGSVACWGSNRSKQAAPPDGHFTSIATGEEHSCGIRTGGFVACWGNGADGATNPPPGRFTSISAGNRHTCAISSGGAVSCWGRNDHGEADPPEEQFASVSLGAWHSCGITADRTVECWGGGWDGQTRPPEKRFAVLESGWEHTCGIDMQGAVVCWGYNGEGQANAPPGIFIDVTAGDRHSCGIRSDHTLACWSRNTTGPTPPRQAGFTTVEAGDRQACALATNGAVTCWSASRAGQSTPPGEYTALAAGQGYSCGIRTDGAVTCWGPDWMGRTEPPKGEYTAVAVGRAHTCGLHTDQTVSCWGGGNIYGEASPPTGEYREITAGSSHSCGLRSNGAINCWGTDHGGVTDAPGGRFTTMASGSWHSCAIATTGSLACWGNNFRGKADPPAGRFVKVAASLDHSCGIRADQTVVCWGSDDHGQARPPTGSFTDITAGPTYSCATRTDGTIACWGRPLGKAAPSAVEHLSPAAPVSEPVIEALNDLSESSPHRCRPPGPAGFPLPHRGVSPDGRVRVAVLFMDFPDAVASHSTQVEADLGLPYAEEYLEAASYGAINIEFEPLHRWLRAEHDYRQTRLARGGLNAEAVRLADPDFDFSGYHALMVILPRTHFANGVAGGWVTTQEGIIWNNSTVNNDRRESVGGLTPWGSVGAHELAHNLGLLDLYPFDLTLRDHSDPPEGKRWINHQFGLMGLWALFPAVADDPRLGHVWRMPDGDRFVGYQHNVEAQEMLAWSRWQLGWLAPDRIYCAADLQTEITVALSPVAEPGRGTAMIAIPVSRTEVIVLETRRKLGYDAGTEFSSMYGTHTTFPGLLREGVLLYTVNSARSHGALPIQVVGPNTEDRPLHFRDYPILTAGQSLTIRGYTITVQSSTQTTDTITISKTGTS